MYAVAEIAGKQYILEEGKTVEVDRLGLEAGSALDIDKVCLIKDKKGDVSIGQPYIEGAVVKAKVEDLSEFNPMLGHRGCRLGNTYPEITEMQSRAIIEAALDLKKRKIKARPEIMIPLTGTLEEMKMQEKIVRETIAKVFEERNDKIYKAYEKYRYSLKEIGDFLGIHYSTVSKIIKKTKNTEI